MLNSYFKRRWQDYLKKDILYFVNKNIIHNLRRNKLKATLSGKK
jgi:hypothetical protein